MCAVPRRAGREKHIAREYLRLARQQMQSTTMSRLEALVEEWSELLSRRRSEWILIVTWQGEWVIVTWQGEWIKVTWQGEWISVTCGVLLGAMMVRVERTTQHQTVIG